MANEDVLLDVRQLKVGFNTKEGPITAINNVSFQVEKGEIVAIVGESGSGKSVTANAIMKLISDPGKIEDGQIIFKDKDLVQESASKMRSIRGNDISMIFQEPMTSLNPLFTVGNQIDEAIRLHQKVSSREARKLSINMLTNVGIPRPDKVYSSYPHTLSGGMRQRVMIAMALSCEPLLLIADEPTTALDVTIQAQILELLDEVIEEKDMSVILITHDLGVVAEMADRVIVMYAGQIVEENEVFELFENPKHPYTIGLLESTITTDETDSELITIKGSVPNPNEMPNGCHFHPRCPFAREECFTEAPPVIEMGDGQQVRCWLYQDETKEATKNA